MMSEYQCHSCAYMHGTAAEAQECCGDHEVSCVYFCPRCEFETTDRRAAYEHKCETGVLP